MLTDLVFKGLITRQDKIFAVFSDGRNNYNFSREILENRIHALEADGLDSSSEEEALEKMINEVNIAA